MGEYNSMEETIQDIIYKAIDHKGREYVLDRFDKLYELTTVRVVLNDLGFSFCRRKTYYNSVVELYRYRNKRMVVKLGLETRIIVKLDLETFDIYITAK